MAIRPAASSCTVFLFLKKNCKTAVCANAGWYTMPDDQTCFPYGFAVHSWAMNLRAAFGKRATVLLGEADTITTGGACGNPEAMRQGQHRFERGMFLTIANSLAAAKIFRLTGSENGARCRTQQRTNGGKAGAILFSKD
ncbi:MAG: hypothetical protein H6574_25820 [Lewinellaceae bacterium]|nr:hypothetical protein [Lewinellaceae bacterium]